MASGKQGRFLVGEQEENHVLSHWVCGLILPSIRLRVLTCGRKLLGLWPATQENPSARWSAPNFHQPDSVILQVRAQPQSLPPTCPPEPHQTQLQVFPRGWAGMEEKVLELWAWHDDVTEATG